MSELPAGERTWIDEAADRFERSWRAGQVPRIEDYLAETEGDRRARLLEELLRVERELRGTAGGPLAAEEYRRRFPDRAAVVDAVFGPPPQRVTPGTDRNLLFAVIALQNNFIDQAELIAAFHAWSPDKSRPLGQVLLARGAIDPEGHALVETLVAKHLKKYGDDVRAALGAVADAAARDAIHSIDEAEIRQSISSLPPAAGYVMAATLSYHAPAEQRERYTLTQLHGQGGLGRVWLAHDTDLNREVALKEILPEKAAHPEMWRRLLKEAQVAGQLEHPNIVPVYELSRRSGDSPPFYTMRFVRGQTLGQAIAGFHTRRAEGRLDPLEQPRLLQAFVSVCQAIGYAHSRGVIHRDLKPENVVLGGFGEVLVLDWGLAKMVDRPDADDDLASLSLTDDAETAPTRMGQTPGTPAYMAPEQAEGRLDLIDSRTDIYGLGAILFEILTGRPPHRGQNVPDLIRQVATGETPRARAAEPLVPAALDAISAKAMARKPGDRYAKATELAEDVQRWLADEPVSAYREGWSQRLARWSRRHRAWVQAGAALLVLVVLFTIGFAIQQKRSAERIREEQARTDKANRAVSKANTNLKDALREARRNGYIAHINLAQREWEIPNVNHARELLKNSDEAEFRGFEWYYLKRLYNPELLTLIFGDLDGRWPVAFSPDGTRLASAGYDTLKVWDVSSGREAFTLDGRTGSTWGVAFSPDGENLASGHSDGIVKLWNVATGKQRLTLKGHTGWVGHLVFSSDGTRLASAGNDTLKVWDATTGRDLLTLKGHTGGIIDAMFSPDGTRLASASYGSASDDATVKVWDAATGQELLTLNTHGGGCGLLWFSPNGTFLAYSRRSVVIFKPSHYGANTLLWDVATGQELLTSREQSSIRSLSFSPDGKRLTYPVADTVGIWDAVTRQELLMLKGHIGEVCCASFSPDGTRLASGGKDQAVKLWDAATGKVLRTLKGHTGSVGSVSFSPDGTRLVSGSEDWTVKLWDGKTGQELLTLKGHTSGVGSVSFTPDGKHLVSAPDDLSGNWKLWDAAPRQEPVSLQGYARGGTSVAFSPDGKHVAFAGWGAKVELQDALTGAAVRHLEGHTDRVNGVAFSPDGKRLASASDDGTVKLWDPATGVQLFTLEGHTKFVNGVAYSPDGQRVASASSDRTVKVWDATTGQGLLTLRGHVDAVNHVSFSPDGKRLASASWDRTIKLWDTNTGQELSTLKGHTDAVHGVAFSPDGKRLASASEDRTVKVWDAATGELLRTIEGHTAGVLGVSFGHDGQRIATASEDTTIRLWDSATGQELLIVTGHTAPVDEISLSSDGKYLASASLDHTVALWDAASGRQVRKYGRGGGVRDVAFSSDGKHLTSANPDGTLKLWDAATGQELSTMTLCLEDGFDVQLSRDGKRRAFWSWGYIGLIRDSWSQKEQALILEEHAAMGRCASFSLDGQRFASGVADGRVIVWDAATGRQLRTLTPFRIVEAGTESGLAITSVALSAEGKYVACASGQSVNLWDVGTGQELLTLNDSVGGGQIVRMAFSPDGGRLVSATFEGTVEVRNTATGEKLVSLKGNTV